MIHAGLSLLSSLELNVIRLRHMEPCLLLVWNEIPEKVRCFLLPLKGEAARLARKSANKYINADELEADAPIFALSEWLATDEGKLTETQVPIKSCSVTQVVVAGYFM
jgi:hypothetical protein